MANHEIVKKALENIFSGIELLRSEIQIKEFTIDGRLVGDIGVTAHDIFPSKWHFCSNYQS